MEMEIPGSQNGMNSLRIYKACSAKDFACENDLFDCGLRVLKKVDRVAFANLRVIDPHGLCQGSHAFSFNSRANINPEITQTHLHTMDGKFSLTREAGLLMTFQVQALTTETLLHSFFTASSTISTGKEKTSFRFQQGQEAVRSRKERLLRLSTFSFACVHLIFLAAPVQHDNGPSQHATMNIYNKDKKL